MIGPKRIFFDSSCEKVATPFVFPGIQTSRAPFLFVNIALSRHCRLFRDALGGAGLGEHVFVAIDVRP
jgi:hypothetical protein